MPWAVFSFLKSIFQSSTYHIDGSGVASSISEGDIFIYSCSAQLISFEIKSILKKVNCAEHKYMNMSPSLIELATRLLDATLAKMGGCRGSHRPLNGARKAEVTVGKVGDAVLKQICANWD